MTSQAKAPISPRQSLRLRVQRLWSRAIDATTDVIEGAIGRFQFLRSIVLAAAIVFVASLAVFVTAFGTNFSRATRIVELHILAAGLISILLLWKQNRLRDRSDRILRLIEQFHQATAHPGAQLVDRAQRAGRLIFPTIEQNFPDAGDGAQVRAYLDHLELFALSVLSSDIDEGPARAVAASRIAIAWFVGQGTAAGVRATMGQGVHIWENLERLANRWTAKAINQNMGPKGPYKLHEEPRAPRVPD